LVAVAPGREGELIANDDACWAVIDKVRVAVAVCCGELLSVTVTPREKVPPAVGVPEMIPLDVARVSPDGSWPEVMLQL
jgi:hypothetical protein